MYANFSRGFVHKDQLTWERGVKGSIGRNDDGMDGSVFHTGDHFIATVKSFVQLGNQQ